MKGSVPAFTHFNVGDLIVRETMSGVCVETLSNSFHSAEFLKLLGVLGINE
jgi:hypothetical protein